MRAVQARQSYHARCESFLEAFNLRIANSERGQRYAAIREREWFDAEFGCMLLVNYDGAIRVSIGTGQGHALDRCEHDP
jgi:hypothetical protein